MKYYSYSVKDKLTAYFGKENTVAAMRNVDRNGRKPFKDWVPLAWQYADNNALGFFVAHSAAFLVETILTDDYIVYLTECDGKNKIYLMFMFAQQQAPFGIDVAYARQLTEDWGKKYNCETVIIGECVGVAASNGLLLSSSGKTEYVSRLYTVDQVNGKYILAERINSCWPFFFKKLVYVAMSNDIKEYECLFEPDVKITKGDAYHKEVLYTGIPAMEEFLEQHAPVQHVWKKDEKAGCYFQEIFAGKEQLVAYISRRNLIGELNISGETADAYECLAETEPQEFGSLIAKIPEIKSIRALDIAQIHGYGIQLSYADGTVRNYYLKTFVTRDIPRQFEMDGCLFTKEILQSVQKDKNNGAQFANGYKIKAHILYYRSYRQEQIDPVDSVLYEDDTYLMRLYYQTPLTEFHGHTIYSQYWGNPAECFGPAFTMQNNAGKRTSDIAYYNSDSGDGEAKAAVVCAVPDGKYGILKNDGNWLLPPIYAKVEGELTEGCIKAVRAADGKVCLLTPSGKEVVLEYPFDAEQFINGRCPVNTCNSWQGEKPDKGGYWEDEDMEPGKWGFIDHEGQFVIKPQYVYVTSFYENNKQNCIVARIVEGKLRWGVIDRDGTEVIPCKYPYLYCQDGSVIIYQEKEEGLFGLMEFDGTVIAKPQFGHIEDYYAGQGMIVAGKDEVTLGVYSVKLHSFIIPERYDYIYFYKDVFVCEFTGGEDYLETDSEEEYYDCTGKQLLQSGLPESYVSDKDEFAEKGFRLTGKEKQLGLADDQGNVILKPAYSSIRMHGEFIEASQTNDTNWSVRDFLFDMKGNLVLKGVYRNLLFAENNEHATMETPEGEQYIRIERKTQERKH